MSITLLIERQNPITRLNRSDRGASELRVALRADALVGAGSGMRWSDLRVGHCGSPHRGAWVPQGEWTGGHGAASRQTEARRVSLARAHASLAHPYYQSLVLGLSTITLLCRYISTLL